MTAGRDDRSDSLHPAATAFANAAAHVDHALTAPELLPTRLSVAVVRSLPVDGAGVSLMSQGYRVPLGASDAEAASAERLQFTAGEGPCLQALGDRSEVRASQRDIARRWPTFHAELVRATPFRSIASIPLRISPLLNGGLDLYFHAPEGALAVDLDAAADVAGELAGALRRDTAAPVPSLEEPGRTVPAWAYGPSAMNRLRVWIATGMLMSHFDTDAPRALALLQSYVWRSEQDLDDVTDALLGGKLKPQTLAT